jgi:hypothetical protein
MKGIDMSNLKGIDMSNLKGMNLGNLKGMDLGNLKGMNLGNLKGMDLGNLSNLVNINEGSNDSNDEIGNFITKVIPSNKLFLLISKIKSFVLIGIQVYLIYSLYTLYQKLTTSEWDSVKSNIMLLMIMLSLSTFFHIIIFIYLLRKKKDTFDMDLIIYFYNITLLLSFVFITYNFININNSINTIQNNPLVMTSILITNPNIMNDVSNYRNLQNMLMIAVISITILLWCFLCIGFNINSVMIFFKKL